ncbi:hypothetical protein [Clostridium gasigenes]|uniref:hypothetical protein n=1 Tax=Clostridium gasigenes TaxID=94869 RepID=UPI001C0BAF1C|nr:hypothetical protein [Clostridium gasigenes]MBU3105622.1 hypothetical protein [Clostridium gasigenes]
MIIGVYEAVVRILAKIKYPIGFDLYVSKDGRSFKSIVKRGLKNPNNYGGRILFVDNEEELYLGTANPFQGCEVWKGISKKDNDCYCGDEIDKSYDSELNMRLEIEEEIEKHFTVLKENLPKIMDILPKETFHNFI